MNHASAPGGRRPTRATRPDLPANDTDLAALGQRMFGRSHDASVTVMVQAVIEAAGMIIPRDVTPRARAAILRAVAERLAGFADELDPPAPDLEGPAIVPIA